MKYFSIVDYGAVSDITCVQTSALQAAIDDADKGFGTVIIPCGTFIVGTVNLKSASIHLEKCAVLKGSQSIEDYVFNGYKHNEMGKCLS